MKAYYIQKAHEIFPIFGVNSLEEAKSFVAEEDRDRVVETQEAVYMNLATGSVDFESGWDDLEEVVEVWYNGESEAWEEA